MYSQYQVFVPSTPTNFTQPVVPKQWRKSRLSLQLSLFLVIVAQIIPFSSQQSFSPTEDWRVSSSSGSASAAASALAASRHTNAAGEVSDAAAPFARPGLYGSAHTCTDIPQNFTLCKNIGYSKMMIPNLLGHDSLQEAEFHAKSWVPLLGLQCHPDTQLFLCSLFSPICLDRPILPCRSLCEGVQEKCEPRMLVYKYPWPSMLNCNQFPEDNDLCIRPGAANRPDTSDDLECPACHQAHTCENIVDNFCRANFVFRAKFRRSRGSTLEFRKGRWFKPREGAGGGGGRRGREFRALGLDPKDNCCTNQLRPGQSYIVMGEMKGDQRVINFVMPWNGKDKVLKNAVRTFRAMDCSNPLPMSVMAPGGESDGSSGNGGGNRRKRRKQGNRRRGRQYGGCRVSSTGKPSDLL